MGEKLRPPSLVPGCGRNWAAAGRGVPDCRPLYQKTRTENSPGDPLMPRASVGTDRCLGVPDIFARFGRPVAKEVDIDLSVHTGKAQALALGTAGTTPR